jgi:hypothetical protein
MTRRLATDGPSLPLIYNGPQAAVCKIYNLVFGPKTNLMPIAEVCVMLKGCRKGLEQR